MQPDWLIFRLETLGMPKSLNSTAPSLLERMPMSDGVLALGVIAPHLEFVKASTKRLKVITSVSLTSSASILFTTLRPIAGEGCLRIWPETRWRKRTSFHIHTWTIVACTTGRVFGPLTCPSFQHEAGEALPTLADGSSCRLRRQLILLRSLFTESKEYH